MSFIKGTVYFLRSFKSSFKLMTDVPRMVKPYNPGVLFMGGGVPPGSILFAGKTFIENDIKMKKKKQKKNKQTPKHSSYSLQTGS